jgi:hypothetical protein
MTKSKKKFILSSNKKINEIIPTFNDMLKIIDYIHKNPVLSGFVNNPEGCC